MVGIKKTQITGSLKKCLVQFFIEVEDFYLSLFLSEKLCLQICTSANYRNDLFLLFISASISLSSLPVEP